MVIFFCMTYNPDFYRRQAGDNMLKKPELLFKSHGRIVNVEDFLNNLFITVPEWRTVMKQDFDVILFDLGGVLVKLGGISQIMDWTGGRYTERQIWEIWLSSPGVRKFESGKTTSREFGRALVEELSLPVSPAQFLRAFMAWPKGRFPGARKLLESLSEDYSLCCLSNTNQVHWNRIVSEMGLTEYFAVSFVSFQLGMLKPDREIFRHVIDTLDIPPRRILFLDDNQINVDAGADAGMTAVRVNGLNDTVIKLRDLRIINRSPQRV